MYIPSIIGDTTQPHHVSQLRKGGSARESVRGCSVRGAMDDPGDPSALGASQAIGDSQEAPPPLPRIILTFPPPNDDQHAREFRERERAIGKALECLNVDKALQKQLAGVCDSFRALFDVDAIDEKQRVISTLEQISEFRAGDELNHARESLRYMLKFLDDVIDDDAAKDMGHRRTLPRTLLVPEAPGPAGPSSDKRLRTSFECTPGSASRPKQGASSGPV